MLDGGPQSGIDPMLVLNRASPLWPAVLPRQVHRCIEPEGGAGPLQTGLDVVEWNQPGLLPGGAANVEEARVGGKPAADREPDKLGKPPLPGRRHQPIPGVWIRRRPAPIRGQ